MRQRLAASIETGDAGSAPFATRLGAEQILNGLGISHFQQSDFPMDRSARVDFAGRISIGVSEV